MAEQQSMKYPDCPAMKKKRNKNKKFNSRINEKIAHNQHYVCIKVT